MSQILVNAGVTGLACRDSGRLRNHGRLYFLFLLFILLSPLSTTACLVALSCFRSPEPVLEAAPRSEQSGQFVSISLLLRFEEFHCCRVFSGSILTKNAVIRAFEEQTDIRCPASSARGRIEALPFPVLALLVIYVGLESYPRAVKL